MSEELFIWIVRWEDFQHYTPDPANGPRWIKQHTPQHDDDRYMGLPPYQRAVLHDLRIAFARARLKLSTDTRRLSQRVGYKVTRHQLESLNHAGFIEMCSREALETRLEEFYTSRARARARENQNQKPEKEEDSDQDQHQGPDASANPNGAGLDVQTELELAELLAWIGDDADTRTAAVLRHNWQHAPEAARIAVNQSRKTSRPRHRGKWLVSTIKAETARARGAP